jgi:hypothetical protein
MSKTVGPWVPYPYNIRKHTHEEQDGWTAWNPPHSYCQCRDCVATRRAREEERS